MINSSQPNFRIAQSTPSTMPLPHGQSYGFSGPQTKGLTASFPKPVSKTPNTDSLRTGGGSITKQASDMAKHLDSTYNGPKALKSFGGKGWGGQ